ncbi:DegV family protein [Aggregatilineales bacterium SYSU G02658]
MSIAIVTDSSARFARRNIAQQYTVHVLPNTIEIGPHRLQEGPDFVLDDLLRLMADPHLVPRVVPPSMEAYAGLYRQLVRSHTAIVSIHPSRELSKSFDHARGAAVQVQASTCPIVVLDSRTICAAQGIVVQLAAQLAQEGAPLAELLDTVRSALERVYSMYYVETLEYLRRNKIMADSRAVLGSLLGIKPLLTIEDGQFKVTEKVRTRGQAIDQLVEFLTEFDDIEETVILQARTGMTEQVRMTQERLSAEWGEYPVNFTTYCAAVAALLGAEAAGVVILESEYEYDDDFSED